MFYRCTHADGRVVVAPEVEGEGASPLVGTTWQEARTRMDMFGMSYVPGHGWYWNSSLWGSAAGSAPGS